MYDTCYMYVRCLCTLLQTQFNDSLLNTATVNMIWFWLNHQKSTVDGSEMCRGRVEGGQVGTKKRLILLKLVDMILLLSVKLLNQKPPPPPTTTKKQWTVRPRTTAVKWVSDVSRMYKYIHCNVQCTNCKLARWRFLFHSYNSDCFDWWASNLVRSNWKTTSDLIT